MSDFDSTKRKMKQYNKIMSVIFGGSTKYLQSLEPCTNKPFKSGLNFLR